MQWPSDNGPWRRAMAPFYLECFGTHRGPDRLDQAVCIHLTERNKLSSEFVEEYLPVLRADSQDLEVRILVEQVAGDAGEFGVLHPKDHDVGAGSPHGKENLRRVAYITDHAYVSLIGEHPLQGSSHHGWQHCE
jgi:hypothetical protein